MALTPVYTSNLYSGTTPPAANPEFPNENAQYIHFDTSGNSVVDTYDWNIPNQAWVKESNVAANWISPDACGWYGKHNHTFRPSPTHTLFPSVGMWYPQFSVSVPSTSAIPFQLIDLATSTVVASGTFPANATIASAATCGLTDSSSTPITSFNFLGSTRIVCVPTGGHAAMPTDGETFEASGYVVIP